MGLVLDKGKDELWKSRLLEFYAFVFLLRLG